MGIESCVEFVCGLKMTWFCGGIETDLFLVWVVEVDFVFVCRPIMVVTLCGHKRCLRSRVGGRNRHYFSAGVEIDVGFMLSLIHI